jgi:hypothetical protein
MKKLLPLLAALAALAAAPAHAAGFEVAPGTRSVVFQEGDPTILVYEGSAADGAPNATNNAGRGLVRIYEKLGSEPFAAVAAQEVFEIDFKRGRGPIGAQSGKRRMEILSHAVESLVAARFYGWNLDEYEQGEAASMLGYSHLRGLSQEQIVAAMRSARPAAEQWVRRNDALIRRLVAFRFPRGRD